MADGIKIEQKASNISFNWDNVFDVLTDVSTHGLASIWGEIPSIGDISNFIKSARRSVGVSEPVETAAFRLVLLCFASAIDEMRPTNVGPDVLAAARETIAHCKKTVKDRDYYLTEDFFTTPVSLPLYQDIRSHFIDAFELIWPPGCNIGGKLDQSFNLALYKISRREPSLVDNLIHVIDRPGSSINTAERDWIRYSNSLAHSFYVKPVFGQEETHVSLSQVFIGPRATYLSKNTDENDGTETSKRVLVDLTENTIEWIGVSEPTRCVRLIRGGPGSGKSSFAKSICAKLAKSNNFRPLFIELQRLPTRGTLHENVAELLVAKEENFAVSPLRKENLDENRPLVLVFDGLDELVIPKSEGVQKIAEDFWDDLDDLLETLNTNSKVRAKAIVTGRDPIIQAAQSSRRGRRLDKKDALKIEGLGELTEEFVSIDGCTIEDQRDAWWEAYATATGSRLDTPPILKSGDLDSLTNEPLLCYLIALSGKAEESHDAEISNINEVYEKLIHDVWRRVWGDLPSSTHNMDEELRDEHRRVGPLGVFESKSDFERILEYVSIAAWRGGESRTATLSEFVEAVKETEVEDIWLKFQKSYSLSDADQNFSTLALTFFFKQNELDGQGFEFTHRSFGEYLTSRSLWRYWHENSDRLSSIRRVDQLFDWLQLTSKASLTEQIFEFLKNEFRRKKVDELKKYQTSIKRCFELVLSQGFAMRIGDNETWRDAEKRHKNAEGAMLCCLSAVTVALIELTGDDQAVQVGFERNRSGRPFINRMGMTEGGSYSYTRFDESGESVYRKALASIDFSAKPIKTKDTEKSEKPSYLLRNSDYDLIRLFNSDLSYCDFSWSNMRAAGFSFSNLHKSNFEHADLQLSFFAKCDFTNAKITAANFSKAVIPGAIFSHMVIERVRFDGADLRESKFQGCSFRDVSFSGANLLEVDFSQADLSNCTGLMQSQINKALGNEKTRLPKQLKHPKKWLEA